MLVILISAIKEKKAWSLSYLVFFSILCIVVSFWRTESFFYMLFACVLVFFINKDVISIKKKIVSAAIILVGFLCINSFQNFLTGNDSYKVMSLVRPCAELVRAADPVEDEKLISDIDKVLSVDIIYANPEANGEILTHYHGVIRSDYSEKDYDEFFTAFMKMAIKYPGIVIEERMEVFISATGITGESENNVTRAAELFLDGNNNTNALLVMDKGWFAFSPVFAKVRQYFIYLIGANMDNIAANAVKWLVWNSMIPIVILVAAWIELLIKRKWYMFAVCSAVLIRLPVVILTQPTNWFMYFLSFYLLGYVYLLYKVLAIIKRRELKKETV